MEIYLVGGAVRDRLLGQAVKEKDYVVVGASPEELLAEGFKPVGKDFPVFLHPTTHEEYALARTERKEGSGYTGFSVYAAKEVSLEEDLKRRDLTINAIAQKIETGEIIDPYKGCRDIEKRVLRHVSDAFIEDPVRILRIGRFMARFAPLGFQIASDTLELMQMMVNNGEVDALVPERIWREFEKALKESRPEKFITTLEKCGAWRRVCPEWQCVTQAQHERALSALEKACELTSDTVVRFTSLMKFIAIESGKLDQAESLTKRWRLPRAYRDLLILSIHYSERVRQASKLSKNDLLGLLEHTDAMRRPDRFEQFLNVCEADWLSDVNYKGKPYTQKTLLLSALEIVQSISIAALIEAELEGEAFSEQLRQLRIQALEQQLSL